MNESERRDGPPVALQASVGLPKVLVMEDLMDADDAEFVLDEFRDDDALFASFATLIRDMDQAASQVRLYAQACPHKALEAIKKHNATIRQLVDREAGKSYHWHKCDCGRWCMDDDPEGAMCAHCALLVEEEIERQANTNFSGRRPASGSPSTESAG